MRKQLLLFTLLLFIATQTKAQTSVYHPFPDSNATWSEYYQWSFIGSDQCCECYWFSLFINGDTNTIGGKLYHKIYGSGQSIAYPPPNCIGGSYNNIYAGNIRQDTMQKKVFILNGLSDTLLYDFDLTLGDTLPASFTSSPNYNYVSEIDSILIGNNYRKRFWINVLPPYIN